MEETVQLEVGEYTGHFVDGRPHGEGTLTYTDSDPMQRYKYDGKWADGLQSGNGSMSFKSGDVYRGEFKEGVPHGKGEFRYVNGDVETAVWDRGQRHGVSVYKSPESEESLTFKEGIAEGPSTYKNLADGSVEEREFRNGVKAGKAVVNFVNGDRVEWNYVNNELNGKAVLHLNGITEECVYVDGVKQGQSVEFKGDDREERTYVDGVLEGDATVVGKNGDRLEFRYKKGKRSGSAKYYWSDGSVELCLYDDDGVQNGPAKLTWPNGAVREGRKKDGQWHGEVLYTYAEGPRKGKKDIETWELGELVKSQKFYGHGEGIEVDDWEDLKKLEDLTKSNPTL